MTSLFERFERSEIEFFHLNQIVDIGHVWMSREPGLMILIAGLKDEFSTVIIVLWEYGVNKVV